MTRKSRYVEYLSTDGADESCNLTIDIYESS